MGEEAAFGGIPMDRRCCARLRYEYAVVVGAQVQVSGSLRGLLNGHAVPDGTVRILTAPKREGLLR